MMNYKLFELQLILWTHIDTYESELQEKFSFARQSEKSVVLWMLSLI